MNSFSSLLSKRNDQRPRYCFIQKSVFFSFCRRLCIKSFLIEGTKKFQQKSVGTPKFSSKVLDAMANNLSTQLGINAQYVSSWWKECMVLWQFVSTCFINFIQTQFKGYFEEVIDFQYWSFILVCFLIKYYQGFFLIEV